MGSNRRDSSSRRCSICKIRKDLCFCESLKPLNISTPIQILMHFRELNLTSNTSHFMDVIHADCQIFHRGLKNDLNDTNIDYNKLKKEETHQPLFLYPDESSVILTEEYIRSLKKPINLIVPDGSWRQAKKFKKRISELQNIPSITLPSVDKSKYSVRSASQDNMLSTFEAIANTLKIIEGDHIYNELMETFSVIIERIEMSRRGGNLITHSNSLD